MAAASEPTIFNNKYASCTANPQKVVTSLPAGMRYVITDQPLNTFLIDTKKIVPAEYTPLQYLSNNGEGYIDTGWGSTYGMEVAYGIKWHAHNQYMCGVGVYDIDEQEVEARADYGNGKEGKKEKWTMQRPKNANGFVCIPACEEYPIRYWWLGMEKRVIDDLLTQDKDNKYDYINTYSGVEGGIALTTYYSIKYSTNNTNGTPYFQSTGLFNGLPISITTKEQKTSGSNVLLFTGNTKHFIEDADLYYVAIRNHRQTLVRNLIPVRRDSDGALGMYDTVEDKLYTNNGKGKFTAGPAVNTAIKNWQWCDSVDDPANEMVLEQNKVYYVYYYTPTSDATDASYMNVKAFMAASHRYSEMKVTTPATCTTDGECEYVCMGCGDAIKETIPALGHNYRQEYDAEKYEYKFTCTRCGDSYTRACINKDGHEYADTVIEPTCETPGRTKHKCVHCGHEYVDNNLPATGHHYGAWQEVTPATCTTNGEQKRQCEHCERTETRPILAQGHDFGGEWVTVAVSEDAVRQQRTCQHGCGMVEERLIDPYQHQITIHSMAHDQLQLNLTLFSKQKDAYNFDSYLNHLHNVDSNALTITGSVRYYDPATKRWQTTAVVRVAYYNLTTFAYYYRDNNNHLVKVVTTLSHLTITDEVTFWGEVTTV